MATVNPLNERALSHSSTSSSTTMAAKTQATQILHPTSSVNSSLKSSSDMTNGEIICYGWMLKKRRKKMQGFARRYFVLDQSGVLSYSFQPGDNFRDHIMLQQAAVSTIPGRKDIHVDGDSTTFHIKCLSMEDFNMWMTAIRRFTTQGDTHRSQSVRGRPRLNNLNRGTEIVESMGQTLTAFESALSAIPLDDPLKKKRSRSNNKLDAERHRESKDGHHSVFGLFKKSSPHPISEPLPEIAVTSSFDTIYPANAQRLRSLLEILKSQHSDLTQLIQGFISAEPSSSGGLTPHGGSPLLPTMEYNEYLNGRRSATPLGSRSGSITPRSHSRYSGQALNRMTSLSRATSRRESIETHISDESEWYDAPEMIGEEFVLEVPGPGGEEVTDSHITNATNETEMFEDNDATSEEDSGDEAGETTAASLQTRTRNASSTTGQIVRRTQLPSSVVGDEGSLFAVLKKNVGKDLSTVSFPVTFNEPLTLLQRHAEEVEYYSLLDEAAHCNDDLDRLCLVAAFAVSGYANTAHRSGRKGFNPMLAETFEDSRMKFIAEKVCHNPVIMAYHAEGDGWELGATSAGKTKFWGKSLEIIPLGVNRVSIIIHGRTEHYEWKRPSSFMRNLMVGQKYVEHVGKMVVENTTTNMRCVLDFKQAGYWGPSNVVAGDVLAADNTVLSHIDGKWDDQLARTLDVSQKNLRVLWKATPFPRDCEAYYGFTAFGITLNEITPEMKLKLPRTDSRFRPDVRALEDGNVDLAEEEKVRVEEEQRERRRKGQNAEPRWFRQQGEEWVYTGGYWEQRAKGWDSSNIQPLW